MLKILEELVGDRLSVLDGQVEQTEAHRKQKEKLDACIEEWLEVEGADKKMFVETLLIFIYKKQELMGKDTFLRGFCLGALAAMETHINEGSYISLGEKLPRPFLAPTKEGAVELPYVSLIMEELANGRVKTVSPCPNDPRYLAMERSREAYLETAATQNKLNAARASLLEKKVFAINEEMLKLKSGPRFGYGYSLGELLITGVFETRARLITG